MEWYWSFYHCCIHSKILQDVAKYRSIEILFRIAKRSIAEDSLSHNPAAKLSELYENGTMVAVLILFVGNWKLVSFQR